MSDARTQTPEQSAAEVTRLARLPMRISERRLILMGLDLVVVVGALILALTLRPAYRLEPQLILQNPIWFLLLGVLWFLLAEAFDAYDLEVAGRFSTAALAVLKAGGLTAVVYQFIPYVTPPLPASRGLLFAFPALTLALVTAGRGLYVLALDQPMFQRRALIVGAGWAGQTIAQALEENGNGTYETVGFVDDDPEKFGTAVTRGQEERKTRGHGDSPSPPLLPSPALPLTSSSPPVVLGDRYALSDLIERHGVNTLVLAITDEVDGELLQIMTDCLEQGVNIIPMPVLYEQLTGRVPVQHVGENWYAVMPILHPGTSATWPVVKRILDVVSAGFGAICLGLAFPFIALAIYLDSPGPIFYTQERVGKGGERFRVYKFRSMVPQAEQEGEAVWAEENDDRVTRVGRILRKMHVDEFPQFFNILKGEMSAVGPRPERPEFVEELAAEIPFYRVRHAVKPGMAGWGLVKQGYGSSKEDAVLKLQYDLYYIKHQSLWLDVVILLKTILDTVTFGGR